MTNPSKKSRGSTKPTAPTQHAPEVEEGAETASAGAASPSTITNSVKGTLLHLGDGRVLAYGESDEVSEALASQLRESGRAK